MYLYLDIDTYRCVDYLRQCFCLDFFGLFKDTSRLAKPTEWECDQFREAGPSWRIK